MMEHTLDLNQQIKDKINQLIDDLNKTTKVKKMNRILDKCKHLVMDLKFIPEDKDH